ncbi:MAG: TIR domain-containing protein, partial [Desulfobacteraceae bacterium]
MTEEFRFDVFISYSSKDKAVARAVAERLRTDGLKIWLDEWVLKPGDNIPAKIEEGLEHSRILVLCMSRNAFGSDWSQLEAGTFRFRDPLNKERRFIPLRLDDAPIKGSLAQFLYINWSPTEREQEYAKVLEACSPPVKKSLILPTGTNEQTSVKIIQLMLVSNINSYVFSQDGKRALSASTDKTVRLWDLETGRCLNALKGHSGHVWSVAWSTDQQCVLAGSWDKTVRLLDVKTGERLREFKGHSGSVKVVVWNSDQDSFLSGADDHTVRVWDLHNAVERQILKGHTDSILSLALSADQSHALSGSKDNTLRLWNLRTGRCEHVLKGHSDGVMSLAFSANQSHALSGSYDNTLRLWDLRTGRCIRVLEGHADKVMSLALSPDQRHALSASSDRTLRIWDLETGRCLGALEGHTSGLVTVTWSADGSQAFSGDSRGGIQKWKMSKFVSGSHVERAAVRGLQQTPEQSQYTNAKVLLVGESGVGKTGLSKRLVMDVWEPSDSTIGAWATQWKLPVSSGEGVEREIWLWDFGGQADQRLIHQLYMDETALAVLVFDGQKEDLFETLGQWDRDLTRASRKEFVKLLVAGRVDAGGLRASRSEVEKFAEERKFRAFLETSAKKNQGCEELKQAILASIDWDEIPCRTTEVLFKRLKEEIIRLKDEGRVLMRFKELRETLQMRLPGGLKRFADEKLRAVLTLLAGPGVVWELAFGSWVLLQPERIN